MLESVVRVLSPIHSKNLRFASAPRPKRLNRTTRSIFPSACALDVFEVLCYTFHVSLDTTAQQAVTCSFTVTQQPFDSYLSPATRSLPSSYKSHALISALFLIHTSDREIE